MATGWENELSLLAIGIVRDLTRMRVDGISQAISRDIVKSCVLNFSGGVLQYSVNEHFSFE